MTQSPVTVPRGALFALVAALSASVLAVAFLVGRESARKPQAAPAPGPTPAGANAPPSAGPGLPAPSDPGTPAAAAETPASAHDTPPPAPSAGGVPPGSSAEAVAPPAPAAAPGASTRDPLRDEVAHYFRTVESIQSQAKSSGDPEALARTMLEQGAGGDASGLEGLAGSYQKVRDALRTVAVPEPCREHHRQTLALFEDSLAMLQRIKGQLGGDDESGLAALPAAGRALEQRARDVDALAAEIKRRFGV